MAEESGPAPADTVSPASRTHDRLATLLDLVDDAVIEVDLNGAITFWSKGAEQMSGYAAAEIIGQSTAILTPPEFMLERADLFRRVQEGENPARLTTTRLRRDGARIECLIVAVPIEDERGSIVGISAIVRDLTKHVETMQALLESNAQLKGVLEQGLAGVYILSSLGHVLYINAAFAELCGYAPEDVIGRPFLDFVIEADRPRLIESLHATLAGTPSRTEAHIISRDGVVRNVLAQAAPVQY